MDRRVSSEWFSRPEDERYLSLSTLYEAVRTRAERATARTVETRRIRVEAGRDDAGRLSLTVPGREAPIAPTHWSFGQMASLVGAPARYLRQLPAALAGINLRHGLLAHRGELIKTLEAEDGRIELRALTGPDYGRIWDHELVRAVMQIAGDGVGDTRWKVPGQLDWSTMTHNPFVEVTKDTTTLYASDRDVFLFLVDDAHPIEAGRLPNGDLDLYFRGFYCWNSEVGSKTLGMASFYLRAVCMNRNIWGAEGFEEISIRHGSPGFLAAYNAGPGRWEDQLTGVRALPTETINYLARLGPMIGTGAAAPSGINPPLRRASPFRSPLFVQISTAPGKDTAQDEAPTTGPIAASTPPGTLLFVPRSPFGAPK